MRRFFLGHQKQTSVIQFPIKQLLIRSLINKTNKNSSIGIVQIHIK